MDLQLSKFISLIKKRNFKEALDYSKKTFSFYVKKGLYLKKLDEHFLFFAYKDPEKCPSRELLDDKHLKDLCILINKEINQGKGNHSKN